MEYGYHKNNIKKGEVGEFSKIEEEFQELKDAHQQNVKIMELLELSDMIGAIESYIYQYNLTIQDLKKMSDRTKSAFYVGDRT